MTPARSEIKVRSSIMEILEIESRQARASAAIAMVESHYEFAQIELVGLRKPLFAQVMIGVAVAAVMPEAQRDGRIVRGLLPQAAGSQHVGMGSLAGDDPAGRAPARGTP